MGEVWEPGQYVMSLKRIKHEIEVGVNRLAHVTVLGLEYGPSTRIPISETERIEAQKLQEEILAVIARYFPITQDKEEFAMMNMMKFKIIK